MKNGFLNASSAKCRMGCVSEGEVEGLEILLFGHVSDRSQNRGTYNIFIQQQELGNGLKPWDHCLTFSTSLSQTRNGKEHKK